MRLVADTSVWSLALRADARSGRREVRRLTSALHDGEVVVPGVVLQEVAQGLVDGPGKEHFLDRARALPLLTATRDDHLVAAEVFRTCRRGGVQLGSVDALLAAQCIRRELPMLTTDRDFTRAARLVDLRVWPN